MLCTVGHFWNGYEDANEQRRYLTFAKMGYVVFVTTQMHYEDILHGYSYQTLMVWNNMRALDFMQSLPEVDGKRLGVCGLSGGGLQSEMIAGLDNRLKAATIAGMTCSFQELSFPHAHHCSCNHFPNINTYSDHPEISTLNLPMAVQYLTMNDWTAHFAADNFPTIQTLYRENGYRDRTECLYWPTEHVYDRAKRERTYWWMEKWVRGNRRAVIVPEPDNIEIVSKPNALLNWKVEVPHERPYLDYVSEVLETRNAGVGKRRRVESILRADERSLAATAGRGANAPPKEKSSFKEVNPSWSQGLKVEEFLVAGEDQLLIPGLVIYPPQDKKTAAAEICLSEAGRTAVEKDPQPYLVKAQRRRGGRARRLAVLRRLCPGTTCRPDQPAVAQVSDGQRPWHARRSQRANPKSHGRLGPRRHCLEPARTGNDGQRSPLRAGLFAERSPPRRRRGAGHHEGHGVVGHCGAPGGLPRFANWDHRRRLPGLLL